MTLAHVAVAAGLAWTLAATPCVAQSPGQSPAPPLDAALELYAQASYDDALAALDEARRDQPSPDDLVIIERHRMLCLVALGRVGAAQDVVAGLLDVRPDFVLTADDASPRVRAVFDAARARLLPDLVRRRFADARRAYDAGDFAAAHDQFSRVVTLLSDPAVAGHDPAAADLQVLANGFLELSASAPDRARAAKDLETVQAAMRIMQVPPAPPAPFQSAPPAYVAAVAASSAAPVSLEAPPFMPMGIFTYDWRDTDVTPPVAVAQPMTGWWGSMGEPAAGTQLGALEVVTDETGAVTDARIYLSVNRVYDNVLLESVKHWRYRPATKDGRAVKYRRVVGVVSGR